ncbi:hypothetical protein BDV33DRAFT_167244 [Aspergillus novoparasiticus]|uniref:Uncharacterized protein n=1 Tax=Aspergillus novoparasiticus TaxID=986946 RepID=A0A5N6F419_9EURO|nr:hypothetical protein BDV33DRAFT_167244 [Aspergillus novoparasiticus]
MAVGGISVGGYLSAVFVHLCRNVNIPLRLQILNVLAVIQTMPSPQRGRLIELSGHMSRIEK